MREYVLDLGQSTKKGKCSYESKVLFYCFFEWGSIVKNFLVRLIYYSFFWNLNLYAVVLLFYLFDKPKK